MYRKFDYKVNSSNCANMTAKSGTLVEDDWFPCRNTSYDNVGRIKCKYNDIVTIESELMHYTD